MNFRQLRLCALYMFGVAFATFSMSMPALAARDFRPHEGYTFEPSKERYADYKEIEMLPAPPPLGPSLRDRIFNDQLSREFRERYEEKFGRTEVERIYLSPNRNTYYNDVYGLSGSPQDINDQKRQFAEYMMKRLLEFHVDNYAKHEPSVRPLWEAKEKISNIKLEVQKFRFDMQYSISGNTFDMVVKNPYLTESKIHIDMDPNAFGPSNVQEAILFLGQDLTPTVNLEWGYYSIDGVSKTVLRKVINSNLAMSGTLSTFVLRPGKTQRESVYLAGVSYVF